MARPPKGVAARHLKAQVRITQAENLELTLRYGSSGRGLRALLDERLDLGPVHRHKRSTVVREDWSGGIKHDVWACECGEELQ